MPDVQAYAARFRGSYHYTGWLSTPEEPIVLEGTITATPDYPALALSYSVDSGDYTDVQEGMEIEVFPASGGYGRLRVAAGGATATTLNVNEVSKSRIDLASGGTFHVLRSFRLRDKLVGATATFPKDSRVDYSDQNWNVAAQGIDGGHYAAIWRGVNIAVPFHGSLSIPVDVDSVPGDLTHAWVVYGPDATTSSASDPVFTFTGPGTNWVRHTVTDTKAGAAWVKWSAVVIDDPATAIPARLDSGAQASYKEGGTLPFRALANAGIDKLPDGALVIYHEDEVIGGVAGSYGGRVESRSRIKFVGFLLSHTITLDAERGTLTFEIASPLRILQSLPGFSQAITAVFPDEPANWQQYEYPASHFTILVYLARWHTTLMELFDTDFGGLRLSMPDNFIQQQTPAAQMQEIADAVDCVLTCARDGAVLVRYEMGIMGAADRNNSDVLFHLTDADILEVQELTYQHRPAVSELIGRAFAAGQPIESISGDAPGEGSENSVVERKIAFSQFGTDYSLNERVGRHFALLNKTYFGVPVPRVVLRLRGSYDFIDPALQQWLLLTLNRTVAGRAVSFNGARLWVESVSIEHGFEADDYGTETPVKYVVVTAWGETDGFRGVTQEIVVGSTTPSYDYEDVSLIKPDPGGISVGTDLFTLPNDDGYLYQTEDGSSTSPTWTRFLSGVTGALQGAVQISTQTTRLIVASSSGLYTLDNVRSTRDLALRKSFANDAVWRDVDAPIGSDLVFSYAYYGNTSGYTGLWYSYSADRGETWSDEVQLSPYYSTSSGVVPTFWVSTAQPGTAIVAGLLSPSGIDPASAFFSLTGLFSVSTQITTPADFNPDHSMFDVHLPVHNNPNDDVVYYGRYDAGLSLATRSRTWRRVGSVTDDISPVHDGRKMRPRYRFSISTGLTNRSLVALSGTSDVSTVRQGVFVSWDGGDSWTRITPGLTTDYVGLAQAGDNPEYLFMWGENGAFGTAPNFDDGVIVDKRGNIPTDFSDAGRFIKLFGM